MRRAGRVLVQAHSLLISDSDWVHRVQPRMDTQEATPDQFTIDRSLRREFGASERCSSLPQSHINVISELAANPL